VALLLAPVDDEDLESLVLSRSPRFQAILNKSRQRINVRKGLSRNDFLRAVAESQAKDNDSVSLKRKAA
jgi:hypothetical protein